jgi:hypothetical protein
LARSPSGVSDRAVEEGAAPTLLERLRVAQPPLHLGGLKRGEDVRLGVEVLVEVEQDLRHPPHDPLEDRLHVLVPWLGNGEEARRPVTLGQEHA